MTSLFFSKIAHTVTTRKFEILSKRRGHIITVFHKVILCTKWEFDYIEGLKQLLSHIPGVPTSCWQKKPIKMTKNEKFTSIWRIFWTKIQNSNFANFSIQNLFRHPVCHKMRLLKANLIHCVRLKNSYTCHRLSLGSNTAMCNFYKPIELQNTELQIT